MPSNRVRLTGPRLWAARCALLIGGPVLLVLLIEGALRLANYGYPTRFFVLTPDGTELMPNRKFVWQFYGRATGTAPHPCLLSPKKPKNTVRIVLLGESAAVGTPDPSFNFGRILEVMLQTKHPEHLFEVVNAAVRGINSHVILPIARECARYEPDLFIVYMGNNEMMGLYSPQIGQANFTSHLGLLRTSQWVKRFKIGQFIASIMVGNDDGVGEQEAETFRRHRLPPDSQLKEAVYENVQVNLEDILQAIQRSGAKAVVATVGVNLRDCPPLGSLHGTDLSESRIAEWESAYSKGTAAQKSGDYQQALIHYRAAVEIDALYADLQFRLGECFAALEDFTVARKHFELARDYDALQFRTDSRLNSIIQEVVGKIPAGDVQLVDIERAFSESELSEGGIPGRQLFREHVHLTFDGDYLMARTIYPAVVSALGLGDGAVEDGGEIPSQEACADVLAFSPWDDINIAAAMVRFMGNPPFMDQLDHNSRQAQLEQEIQRRVGQFGREDIQHSISVYKKGVEAKPNDWQLHFNFSRLYDDFKMPQAAASQFENVIRLMPYTAPLRLKYAMTLAKVREWDDALGQLTEALRLDPDYTEAFEAVERLRKRE